MGRRITIKDLCVRYDGIQALFGVSLDIAAGEVVTVLGANGASKTTLLHAIAGLVPIQSGSILIDGVAINRWRAEQIVRSGISLVPEGRRIFARLSVEENLRLGAYFVSAAVFRSRFEELAEIFPLIAERRRSYAGYLSGGEQQIVALARSLISKPDVLLLDEPSAGLSPIATANVYRSLRIFTRDSKITMLLVEQNVRRALELAHRGYVLELGRVKLEGTSAALEKDERVAALYLGDSI
jgi:branched-chain amino acid transport system ATP-binding protein